MKSTVERGNYNSSESSVKIASESEKWQRQVY